MSDGQMSRFHVVKPDARFRWIDGTGLSAQVRFESYDELDALIEALTRLRNADSPQSDHVHLQDAAISCLSSEAAAVEIVFFMPGRSRGELEEELLQNSRRVILQMYGEDYKE